MPRMAFEEMHRRQQAIAARRRKKKKFSLLLSHITVPTSPTSKRINDRSRIKYAFFTLAPILMVLLFFINKRGSQPSIELDRATVRNKYWKANVVEYKPDHEKSAADRGDELKKLANQSSRSFLYIGDYDPAEPRPWPKKEKDWWLLHQALVQRVRDSDASPPLEFDIDNESRLPQLVFYGDSITEGWRGTSFGNAPGKHRMWKEGEHKEIRRIFDENFGDDSSWGKRALKPPLVLGISGSRTYDFLWRIRKGEFPTSKLLDHHEEEGDGDEGDDEGVEARDTSKVFRLDELERIYIVLMGTNNLGGGMLPKPTVEGMDAVGREILRLHVENFPNRPAAMLFSELLPRRDDFRAAKMCPPRCMNVTSLEPYKSFMPAIEKVNGALPRVAEGWRRDFPNSKLVLLSRSSGERPDGENKKGNDDESGEGSADSNDYATTINCGREMFDMGDEDEFDAYMPDRLHPNAKGYELWSRCIRRGLEVIMDHVISLTDT
mmetsp:Transcript_13706/g.29769  ORF Transcript_13706/g.29769 Transcript_13706/m.29769 type:complete len:492 (-) Transcript_13706:107-1582(-)